MIEDRQEKVAVKSARKFSCHVDSCICCSPCPPAYGQLLLTKGDFEQAFKAFKIVLDGDCNNVPALLGQACVHFSRGQYVGSLQLCKLEPDNVEALVALGILDLQTNEAAGIRKGMEKMQRAFEIYPLCAVSLNYLANHFLFTGKHFLVEQLTETALAVTMHGLTRAHSYYNLALSYHSKGDYGKAGMYYMASIKESKNPHDLLYYHAMVQLKLGDLQGALTNFEIVLEVQPKDCGTLKGNWNCCAANHNEKRNPKLEAAHFEKAKVLYTKVLQQNPANLYAANGAGIVFAEKGQLDIAKDLFTLIGDTLKVDDKCADALLMLDDLELKNDNWFKVKGTFRIAKDSTAAEDSYAEISRYGLRATFRMLSY
ncbi:UNVERIFIED_CONTAM: protein CTR9 [Sesamum radiatum]|uniref:Protein CTR9 n=1 Tax=Sesamum radiatum TaxID=300843 RepID=A0AAW2KNC3_SESRA